MRIKIKRDILDGHVRECESKEEGERRLGWTPALSVTARTTGRCGGKELTLHFGLATLCKSIVVFPSLFLSRIYHQLFLWNIKLLSNVYALVFHCSVKITTAWVT